MKLLKNYFLFFSVHPVLYNFMLWIVVTVAIFILDSLDVITMRSGAYVGLAALFLFMHIIVIYLLVSKYITRPENDIFDLDYLFQAGLYPDGREIIILKPIWGKPKMYNVQKIAHYWNDSEGFSCQTSIVGRFKNSVVSVPVNLVFELSGRFVAIEVFHELLKNEKEDTSTFLSVQTYAIDVFKKMNAQSQSQIDDTISRYAQQQISEPVLLNEIIDKLFFPERLFSNVADVTIRLESPSFSSCKGMACGEEH